MKRKCEDCIHYAANSNRHAKTGQCRINPPTLDGWPGVANNEWCAQWSGRMPPGVATR